MNIKNVTYLLVFSVFVSACSKEASAPVAAGTKAIADAPAGDVVATVNGETITAPMLEVFARGRGLDPTEPTARQRALDTLIENVVLAQDAITRGLSARPEVQAEVALVRLQQLAGRNLSEHRNSLAIGEDQIKAHYDAEVARTGGVEVQLKHILFADQPSAAAANERALAASADFDALMLELAPQAKQARELTWANLTQLPPELAAAVQPLPDGQVAPLPVQTSFGWHVVKRVASRPFAPPAFEEVKEGARKQLFDKAMAELVQGLRDKAKVELPASPAPAPAAPSGGGG